ncbi:hypothetical protein ACIPRL_11200 [Streptomyces sp. NPDC090085]|uniref:hypothetical protein n=1 Tax=Streptomyces sp. NPDC090085 TaxID=3365943 RepID=UPI00380ACEA5
MRAELQAAQPAPPAPEAAVPFAEAPVADELPARAPAYAEQPHSVGEPHPFFGKQTPL